MSETSASVPLTVVSTTNNSFYYAQIAIGKHVLAEQHPKGGPYYWFVVLNRSTLEVEYNQLQTQNNVAPDIGDLNSEDHILIVATLGVGLNVTPQGDLFKFLDLNGAGAQLRRVEQVGQQLNCGSWGTFAYCLTGILGNTNVPGFESSLLGQGKNGLFLTLQLLPAMIDGKLQYMPASLNNA